MLPKVESACFVIADFSGYTNFVSGVELDHAQDIIADIMETLLRALRPTFRLAKFEGDAAFVYAVGDEADGGFEAIVRGQHVGVPGRVDAELEDHRRRRRTFKGYVEPRFDQHGPLLEEP
jgi:hypothetical protein